TWFRKSASSDSHSGIWSTRPYFATIVPESTNKVAPIQHQMPQAGSTAPIARAARAAARTPAVTLSHSGDHRLRDMFGSYRLIASTAFNAAKRLLEKYVD